MDALEPLAATRTEPTTPDESTTDPATDSAADSATASGGLSDRDVRILDFEQHWWRHAGSKEQAIRDRFDVSPTRYYQILNALIDTPEALAYQPTLVKRLRRLRAGRSRTRHRLGISHES